MIWVPRMVGTVARPTHGFGESAFCWKAAVGMGAKNHKDGSETEKKGKQATDNHGSSRGTQKGETRQRLTGR